LRGRSPPARPPHDAFASSPDPTSFKNEIFPPEIFCQRPRVDLPVPPPSTKAPASVGFLITGHKQFFFLLQFPCLPAPDGSASADPIIVSPLFFPLKLLDPAGLESRVLEFVCRPFPSYPPMIDLVFCSWKFFSCPF